MAPHVSRCRWSDEAVEMLHALHGTHAPATTALVINGALGTTFTGRAVRAKAQRLGIDARLATGDYILEDAARALGVSNMVIYAYLNRHGLSTYGKGRFQFVRDADFQAMRGLYPTLDVPCLKVAEAARLLGYTPHHLVLMCLGGRIDSRKRGSRYFVTVRAIEEFRADRDRANRIRYKT